ncbi:hypothetical protein DFP73DRAFT_498411 [Morchella snyderi]|nr:hypothetical protein DFP73DRAFT_498411 [Morchella snyderi]
MCWGRRETKTGELPLATRIRKARIRKAQPQRRAAVATTPAAAGSVSGRVAAPSTPPALPEITSLGDTVAPTEEDGNKNLTTTSGPLSSSPSTSLQPIAPATVKTVSRPSQSVAQPFGLKELYAGSDPALDLVCVHGLNGHREETWTAENGILWLRDLLPSVVPRVRVLSYGYDGRTSGPRLISCQTLHDHAVGLVTDLSQRRKIEEVHERPIIFLAHSIGGIIVKDALLYSNSTNFKNLEYHRGIKTSTYGILFFGTPHQGMENVPSSSATKLSWKQILVNAASPNANTSVFRDLEENSASLQRQLSEYRSISSDFVTKFFYETYPPIAGGKTVVPKDSAVVPGAVDTEIYAVHSDHHRMVQYTSSEDKGFENASRCILEMVKGAPGAVKGNWERWRESKAAIDPRYGHIVALDDRERKEFLSWLSSLEPEKDFERLYSKRHASTGTWLIESTQYTNWLQASESCLLWCRGPAGVGKSVLASIVVKDIISNHPPDDNTGVAYFYFSFQEDVAQTLASVLSALIKQLCRHKSKLPASLLSLYKKCTRNDQSPKLSELREHLLEILGTFSNVFLVMDAMDEFKKEYRQELLPYIISLLNGSRSQLHILVTGRSQPDIDFEFTSNRFQLLQIQSTIVNADIASYVEHVLKNKPHIYRCLDEHIADEVIFALVSQANGIFLWAQCQLDYIYQQPSKAAIRNALRELPRDMKTTYERMVSNIYLQIPSMIAVAKRALTWVVTAGRPLFPKELSTAVAIEPTSTSSLECRRTYGVQVAIDACCGLLTVEGDRVRPIHFTVQEFLTNDSSHIPREIEAHSDLARSSIRYMLCQEFVRIGSTHCRRNFNEEGLDPMLYIWNHWDHHIRCSSLPLPADLEVLLQTFFRSENRHGAYAVRAGKHRGPVTLLGLCATVDLLNIYIQFYGLSNSITTSQEFKEAIDNAASAGSLTALGALLDLRGEGDTRDLDVLYLSAHSGQADSVQFMIDRGLDPDAARGEIGTALQAASYGGRENAVKVLLACGAGVDIQCGEYNTALQAASRGGHRNVVKALLASGASIDIQGGQYNTALQAACCTEEGCSLTMKLGLWECDTVSHLEVLNMLLEMSPDVNLCGGRYGTALQAASYRGHNKIVKTLLMHNADVNITGGSFGTALQAAAAYVGGHHDSTKNDTVKILIENGANINAQGGRYGTALHAASYGCYKTIVDLLLANSADPNIVVGEYGTALQAAAASRYFHLFDEEQRRFRLSIIKALIEKGADVNLQCGKYGSALQAAAYAGYKPVVELLIENGADVNTRPGQYGTAIQTALHGSYMATVHDGNNYPMGNGDDDYFILQNADQSHYSTLRTENGNQGQGLFGVEGTVTSVAADGDIENDNEGRHLPIIQPTNYDSDTHGVVSYMNNPDGGGSDTDVAAMTRLADELQACRLRVAPWEEIVRILLKSGAQVGTAGDEYSQGLALHNIERCTPLARHLVEESVRKGLESKGFKV